MKNYLTYEESSRILAPLYERCPQIRDFQIEGNGQVEKKKIIAVVIAVLCSDTCKVVKDENFLHSPQFYNFLQNHGILEGICDDITSWMKRGSYITKEEAQIIIDNICDYLNKPK